MHEKHVKCQQKSVRHSLCIYHNFSPAVLLLSNLLRDAAISRSQKECESAEK